MPTNGRFCRGLHPFVTLRMAIAASGVLGVREESSVNVCLYYNLIYSLFIYMILSSKLYSIK